MVDKIFLKNDGIFVADDYQSLERASGRLRELENDGKQLIKRRRSNGISEEPANEAALLAASVYEAGTADSTKPSLFVDSEKVFDDDLGRNITLYMDLIQGRVQVPANQSRVNEDGKPRNGNKVYLIYNTDTTLIDNRGVVDGDDQNLGDVLLGALMSPSAANFYENADSLAATTYSGTGDGTLDKQELLNGAEAESITITAQNDAFDTAELVVQDLTYTAAAAGSAGNSITIEYTAGATAGAEVVTVIGNAISIQIEDGVSDADQIKAAFDAEGLATALASCAVSGTGSNAQSAAAATPLAGGSDGAIFDVVGSVGGNYGSYTSGDGDAIVGPICINISNGATPFATNDEFTVTSVAV